MRFVSPLIRGRCRCHIAVRAAHYPGMRISIALFVAVSAATAHAGGFEKYVSDLGTAPAQAAKRLESCQLLVTPNGSVRQPCKLEVGDLTDAAGAVTLAARNVKKQSFPKSMLEWTEADVDVRAGGKLAATYHVIEITTAMDAQHPQAQVWTRPIADKDAAAKAARGAIAEPHISEATAPGPKDSPEQEQDDREELLRSLRQAVTGDKLGDVFSSFAEQGAIVIGSAPGQRYTGKTGAKTIKAWKLDLAQKGGVALGGNSMVAFAATTIVGKTKDATIPYVAFVVYIQRMTGGGSLASFPALVQFAVPQG